MNKYEEAMDIIELSLDYEQLEEARNLLKELIDKATPKKPIYEDLDCYLACPNCWNNIDDLSSVFTDELIKPKYCPRCGQHIDWSDYE